MLRVVNGEIVRGPVPAPQRGGAARRASAPNTDPDADDADVPPLSTVVRRFVMRPKFLAKLGVAAVLLWLAGDWWPTVFALLIFYIILTNLGKKKDGELSAYSVFNDGFKELPGTLNATQLQNQMLYGGTGGPAADGAGVGAALGAGTNAAPPPAFQGAGRALGGGGGVADRHGDAVGDDPAAAEERDLQRALERSKWDTVGPNAPCPCGSGKKYKKCCQQV